MWPRTPGLATADTSLPGAETPPSGNLSVMKSYCGEVGENLNVKCSLAAKLVSRLTGPARLDVHDHGR